MLVVVTRIRRGSVIVDFDIVTSVEVRLPLADVQNSFIKALNISGLGVDLSSTYVTGF